MEVLRCGVEVMRFSRGDCAGRGRFRFRCKGAKVLRWRCKQGGGAEVLMSRCWGSAEVIVHVQRCRDAEVLRCQVGAK